jgi:hypothetical protein
MVLTSPQVIPSGNYFMPLACAILAGALPTQVRIDRSAYRYLASQAILGALASRPQTALHLIHLARKFSAIPLNWYYETVGCEGRA